MSVDEQHSSSNDRILHARNLLKKFQSKNSQRNEDFDYNGLEIRVDNNYINNSTSSSPSILPNFSKFASETRNLTDGELKDGSSASELLPYNQNESVNQIRCYSVPENLRIDESELNGSRSLLIQKQQELTSALSKLNSLHKSYSELYNAYNQLIEKNDGRETPIHVNNQIQQLQIALTHALEEKTILQKELRDVKSNLEELQISAANNTILNQQNQNTDSSIDLIKNNDLTDLRLATIQKEKDELFVTLTNLSQQIEQERQLSSNLEAKLFMAQQDKIDTQAHLKSIYQEKVQLETNYEKCKQELAMRDIYLKQLSKQFQFEHLPQNAKFEEKMILNNKISSSSSSNDQIASLKMELENSRKHIQTLQDQLHSTSLQANSRLKLVEEELENTRNKLNELNSQKDYLEESLRIAQANNEKNVLKNNLNEHVENDQSLTEINSLKQQISILLKEKEEQFNLNKQELNKLNEEKNYQIDQLKNELNEAMERIGVLERDKVMRGNIDQDASTLSILLQNEKSTVSRAIAQNIELKTQLEELQNRLVEVINSSAEKEDERITAISSVLKLRKELEELKEETKNIIKNNNLVEKQIQTDEEIENNLNSSGQTATNISLLSSLDESSSTNLSSEYSHKEESNNEEQNEGKEKLTEVVEEVEESEDVVEEKEQNYAVEDHVKEVKKNEENEENIKNKLQKRLEQLCHENEQYRLDNQKLQYWLTAVETENESIGEYVALYRFQRGNVQKRIVENESLLKNYKQQNFILQTQLKDLCNLINSFLMTNEESNLEDKDNHNKDLIDRKLQLDNLKVLAQNMQKTLTLEQNSSSVICSASNTSDVGSDNLQTPRCTGCAGCRGEMSTL